MCWHSSAAASFPQVSLAELGAERGNHAQIETLLAAVVDALTEQSLAEQRAAPLDPASSPLGSSDADGTGAVEPVLPLVRVRVDYTGFTTIHTQRFGQRFVRRVANPTDILLWAKTSERRVAALPQWRTGRASEGDILCWRARGVGRRARLPSPCQEHHPAPTHKPAASLRGELQRP